MAEEPSSHPTPLAEIEHGPSKFEEFLENNLKKLIFGGLAVVVAVAAYIVVTGLKKTEDHSAGEALLSASDIAGLRDVIETYPASPAAGSAAILLAEEQWKDGREEDAINTLTTFVNGNPDHAARSTANYALGARLLEQGKKDEARTKFQMVVDDPSAKHLAPLALLSLGDLDKAAGDEEAARSHYERALNDFPASNPAVSSFANERLSLLGVAAPVKIAPEKPAEEETPDVAPPTEVPGVPTLTPSNPLAFPPADLPESTPEFPATPPAPASPPAPAPAEGTPGEE